MTTEEELKESKTMTTEEELKVVEYFQNLKKSHKVLYESHEESKHISKGHASEVSERPAWWTLIEDMDKILKGQNDN